MNPASERRHLSHALSELIALRGYARVQGDAQLVEIWNDVAGATIASRTRVLGIRRSVLNVGVSSSALLAELAGFHKASLLASLTQRHPELRIRDLKFRLKGNLEQSRRG